ncbi:Lipoprotein, ToxR-activated gene, TagA [Bathymodiolus thermophilus thioautotrophic gill symbiont]|uniref:Peptidase S1 domain-containing protein n=1 Tax=Bathymodiolus thermophilus thioautotrophic gill symbiont TaxID=2360 RepID=A0A1J5TT03_9GAMM|nr:trypsin-like serine protease [Bathymodiolus thermophilus thioautotrophic gill symbiont]OIR24008.1 hypothetical protein BGC33_08995 [Bathymodiolus thermophilus thioautotrophic gill symbiont]CAB5496206.1 hypothetical protein THERMOT_473 [Bathymodiolus thermophilus thioautotrophic gill symbiont]SGZ91851.1 Lipoprotein, ToxR-activated gene, TagA [Bathymodiolus thermophilus thioautotrophic gill symbiont]
MFYQENVLKKLYKLTSILTILIGISVNPAFAEEFSDAGAITNFQVRIQHDDKLCSGSLLSRKIVITSKHCIVGSNITVFHNDKSYKAKAVHQYPSQEISADKTANEDLGIIELDNAIIGNDISFVKIPTVRQDQTAFADKYPLAIFGFTGGAVTFEENNEYYLLGILNASTTYSRLGLPKTREWLNNFYVDLHHWNEHERKGNIGDLYIYANPYNNTTEYFGLMQLGADHKYWYFPSDKTHNYYWVYLGDTTATNARNRFDVILRMNKWGQNDRKGKIGDDYVHVNYHNNSIEVFTLKALYSDERYWYFPSEKNNNYCWKYKRSIFGIEEEKKKEEGKKRKEEDFLRVFRLIFEGSHEYRLNKVNI